MILISGGGDENNTDDDSTTSLTAQQGSPNFWPKKASSGPKKASSGDFRAKKSYNSYGVAPILMFSRSFFWYYKTKKNGDRTKMTTLFWPAFLLTSFQMIKNHHLLLP